MWKLHDAFWKRNELGVGPYSFVEQAKRGINHTGKGQK